VHNIENGNKIEVKKRNVQGKKLVFGQTESGSRYLDVEESTNRANIVLKPVKDTFEGYGTRQQKITGLAIQIQRIIGIPTKTIHTHTFKLWAHH